MTNDDRRTWLRVHWFHLTKYERKVLQEKLTAMRQAEEAVDATMEAFTYRLTMTADTEKG